MRKFYDNHTHSHFSPDSRMTMEKSLAAAASMANLKGISITDHLDIDAPGAKDYFIFDPAEQQKRIGQLSEIYKDIEIFKGIEVGLQEKCIGKIKTFLAPYKFDVVIASLHFIDEIDPYYGEYYKGKDYKEAYSRAYEVMYRNITEFKDFDILGHFDYIARYAPYEVRDIKFSQFADVLDPILKYLASEGKALEVNTNTYRERNGYTPSPDTGILKRFRELGGEAVSLGSDAHEEWRIAENFEKFAAILKECGFKWGVYYKRREGNYYPL